MLLVIILLKGGFFSSIYGQWRSFIIKGLLIIWCCFVFSNWCYCNVFGLTLLLYFLSHLTIKVILDSCIQSYSYFVRNDTLNGIWNIVLYKFVMYYLHTTEVVFAFVLKMHTTKGFLTQLLKGASGDRVL